ncbi:hypothetical protein LOAG_17986 [Loa loa]|uniref:Uncharacterized protein n=2 Tax=Loa loa TaxID=7209 RepID=A0A1S0UIM1_LOALO|nr:hypothetical protein LOAG_17986 [Loa loa]EJD74737.1 hypothetical protein LOAG_17986 [Loa loa]
MNTIITVTTNTFPLLLLSLLPTTAFSFGSNADKSHCNRLKLEQCFETAFQTMRIRRNVDNDQSESSSEMLTLRTRHRCSLRSVTHVMMPKNQHLCAANRHYLSCFNNDGCQDDYMAHVNQ